MYIKVLEKLCLPSQIHLYVYNLRTRLIYRLDFLIHTTCLENLPYNLEKNSNLYKTLHKCLFGYVLLAHT